MKIDEEAVQRYRYRDRAQLQGFYDQRLVDLPVSLESLVSPAFLSFTSTEIIIELGIFQWISAKTQALTSKNT